MVESRFDVKYSPNITSQKAKLICKTGRNLAACLYKLPIRRLFVIPSRKAMGHGHSGV
jgi:hypothetical protein